MRKHLCAINMSDNQTDAWKDDKEINFMKEEPILHIEIFMVCIYIFYMKLFNCIVYCMAEQLFRCRTACCIYNLGQKRKPCWQNTAYHVWCYNLLFISYWFLSPRKYRELRLNLNHYFLRLKTHLVNDTQNFASYTLFYVILYNTNRFFLPIYMYLYWSTLCKTL